MLGELFIDWSKVFISTSIFVYQSQVNRKALEMHRLLITCQLGLTHAVVRSQSSPLDKSSVGLLERG